MSPEQISAISAIGQIVIPLAGFLTLIIIFKD